MKQFLVLVVLATLPALTSVASAQIPMTGRFVAEARCPALQSIKKLTNPGAVATEPGRSYDLIGRNDDPASHYYINLPNADPARRWVAVGCGRIESEASRAAQGQERPGGAEDPVRGQGANALAEALDAQDGKPRRSGRSVTPHRVVLAASWHPAFCEAHARSRDCAGGGVDTGFSLHGLWPQPPGNEYCGVAARVVDMDRRGDWRRLPEPPLTPTVRQAVERVMPGTRSLLDRHEWLRHGSCYGTDADAYFTDAVDLVDQLNASGVGALFMDSIGNRIDSRTIRAAFDEAFGASAGDRVTVDCARDDGRQLIGELRIHLAGAVGVGTIARLLRNGRTAPRGCAGGIVDPSGFD